MNCGVRIGLSREMEKGRAESLLVLGSGGENHRREAWARGIRAERRHSFRLADREQASTIDIRMDNSLLNSYIPIAPS
jgi:hypothetical protein